MSTCTFGVILGLCVRMAPMTFSSIVNHFRILDLRFYRMRQSQHDEALRTDDGTTSFRKALQERNLEPCRPSNDFPWYLFLTLPSRSTNCSSRFRFRVKRLLTIRFVKPSFGWSGGGGQKIGTVRLEPRIGELEQLNKLCLCDCWLDVSFHSSNSSELIGKICNWTTSSYRCYHRE